MEGDVIYSYTSRQGIEDGLFVEPFPDKFPGCLFTTAVHETIAQKIEGTARTYPQAAIPLLMDAAMIVRARPDPDETLWTKGLDGNVTGQEVWIGRNDLGGLTLMFPEDY